MVVYLQKQERTERSKRVNPHLIPFVTKEKFHDDEVPDNIKKYALFNFGFGRYRLLSFRKGQKGFVILMTFVV